MNSEAVRDQYPNYSYRNNVFVQAKTSMITNLNFVTSSGGTLYGLLIGWKIDWSSLAIQEQMVITNDPLCLPNPGRVIGQSILHANSKVYLGLTTNYVPTATNGPF